MAGLKIALVVKQLNVRGGTHKQLLRLAEYLVAAGHEIRVFTQTYDPAMTYPEFSAFKVISIKVPQVIARWKLVCEQVKQIALALRIAKWADVVNIHDLGCEELTLWLKIATNCMIVWQVNDISHVYRIGASAQMLERWHYPIRRRLYSSIAVLPEVITVNVGKNRARIEKLFARNARLYYCGVDALPDRLDRGDRARGMEIEVVSTGLFFRYRNYEGIIHSLAYARRVLDIQANLKIIGSTKYDPLYAAEVQQLADREGVPTMILGEVDEPTLRDCYRRADLFMFMNIDQSWGLAIFEAMSCGIPCVISNSVGAVEVLEDGVHAIIVPPTNVIETAMRIQRLINNDDARLNMVERARDLTKKMSWAEAYCKPVEHLLRSMGFARSGSGAL